jgi:hypothetical protein
MLEYRLREKTLNFRFLFKYDSSIEVWMLEFIMALLVDVDL